MMRKPFAVDDPMELVGVGLPADAEAMQEMAYVFAEEFARMGFSADRLMRLFRHPFYAAAHQAYGVLGEDTIRTIVDECTQIWGRVRVRDAIPTGQEGA